MVCEICLPDSLFATDQTPNPCQDAEERERARTCDDCGADLSHAQMWEGKQTGMKLCDPCFKRWCAARRARPSES